MDMMQRVKLEAQDITPNMNGNLIDASESIDMTDDGMDSAVLLNDEALSDSNSINTVNYQNDFVKFEQDTDICRSNFQVGFLESVDETTVKDDENPIAEGAEMYIYDSKTEDENCGETTPAEKICLPKRKQKVKEGSKGLTIPDDKKLKCSQCSAVLSSRSGLNRHVLIHTRDPYNCEICDKIFQNKNLLKTHKKKDHPIPKKKEEFVCTVCSKIFVKKESLEKHQKKHEDAEEVWFECNECPKKYRFQKQFDKHKETAHVYPEPEEKSIFTCDVCGLEFSTSDKVRLHMRLHTGEKLNQCQYCNAVFLRSHHLTNHIRKHTGEQPFPCQLCGKRFRRKSYLKEHMRSHTGEKPFTCEICQATLSSKWSLRCHQQTHPEYFETKLFNDQDDKSLLKYKCDVCDKIFKRNDALKNHKMKEHTGERPFKCLVCDVAFRKGSHLINHSRQHTGDSPFVCEVCGGRFRRHSYLRTHMRKHTGERPYECKICEKRFIDNNNLRNHMISCSKEKIIHECGFCKKKYKNNVAFGKHLVICQEKFNGKPKSDFCSCEIPKTDSPIEKSHVLENTKSLDMQDSSSKSDEFDNFRKDEDNGKPKGDTLIEKSDGLEDKRSPEVQGSCLNRDEINDSKTTENEEQSKLLHDEDIEMQDLSILTSEYKACKDSDFVDMIKHSDDQVKCQTCGKAYLPLVSKNNVSVPYVQCSDK